MEVLRQAKEAAVKSCNDQKREVESLMEQLDVTKQKLASAKQQLQVMKAACLMQLIGLFADACNCSIIQFIEETNFYSRI